MAWPYKFFSPAEVTGLDPYLCSLLDSARENAKIPFVLTSGLRTIEENKKAGGEENSTHLFGLAVDIRCRNSSERFGIVKALCEVGFTRIGVHKYRTEQIVHCDIGQFPNYPQSVMW